MTTIYSYTSLPRCPYWGISFSIVKWGNKHKYINHFLGRGYARFFAKNTILKTLNQHSDDPRLKYLLCVALMRTKSEEDFLDIEYATGMCLKELDKTIYSYSDLDFDHEDFRDSHAFAFCIKKIGSRYKYICREAGTSIRNNLHKDKFIDPSIVDYIMSLDESYRRQAVIAALDGLKLKQIKAEQDAGNLDA